MSSLMKRRFIKLLFMGKIRRSRCPHCDSINVISWGERSGHLKDHMRLHRGLSFEHHRDFVKWYLYFTLFSMINTH